MRDWVNWAGDQSCRPAETARPAGREELAETIAAATAAGRKVSIADSGHSLTEAAMTDGTMVRVEALRGVQDADPSSGLVRVGAGTVLADLNEELAALGLAMENLGDIDRQTVAGAISTGTHGTGAGLRNISARVEGLELVLADGRVRQLSAATQALHLPLRRQRAGAGAQPHPGPAPPPAAARPTAATASSPASAASASPRWSTASLASTGRRRRGG